MSDAQNLLQDLKDIHYPNPISWWPPALGWDLLALLFIVFGLTVIWFGFRIWKKRKRLQVILRDYEKIFSRFQQRPKDQTILVDLSIFTKRLIFAYFPRKQVAGLTGDAWLEFLDKVSKTQNYTQGSGRLLMTAPYQLRTSEQTGELLNEIKHLMACLAKTHFKEP